MQKGIFTPVGGWETPAEQGLLVQLASALPNSVPVMNLDAAPMPEDVEFFLYNYPTDYMEVRPPTIVEIGSEYGMSASIFSSYSPRDAHLYCIEINPDAPFVNNLKLAKLNPSRYTWIKGDSQTVAVPERAKRGIDLLFVDGDHSFEGALEDLRRWTPLIPLNGILAIHDCACHTNKAPHPLHYEVSKAVRLWKSQLDGRRFDFLYSVDTTMVFRARS